MKGKSLDVARIFERWGGVVVIVIYNMLAEMRKIQSTIAKRIYIVVRDVFYSTHSQ